jgi:hypothetical protein
MPRLHGLSASTENLLIRTNGGCNGLIAAVHRYAPRANRCEYLHDRQRVRLFDRRRRRVAANRKATAVRGNPSLSLTNLRVALRRNLAKYRELWVSTQTAQQQDQDKGAATINGRSR